MAEVPASNMYLATMTGRSTSSGTSCEIQFGQAWPRRLRNIRSLDLWSYELRDLIHHASA